MNHIQPESAPDRRVLESDCEEARVVTDSGIGSKETGNLGWVNAMFKGDCLRPGVKAKPPGSVRPFGRVGALGVLRFGIIAWMWVAL